MLGVWNHATGLPTRSVTLKTYLVIAHLKLSDNLDGDLSPLTLGIFCSVDIAESTITLSLIHI